MTSTRNITVVYLLSSAFILAAVPPAATIAQNAAITHDEKEVRAVVARYAETWNANDMTAWGDLFTEDTDYVNRGGGWWRTNEENVRGHELIHEQLARQNQEMNLQLTVEDIAFLSSSIALVHVTSKWPGLDLPGGGDGEPQAMMTMVMVEENGTWLIRAFHNTLVTSPGAR